MMFGFLVNSLTEFNTCLYNFSGIPLELKILCKALTSSGFLKLKLSASKSKSSFNDFFNFSFLTYFDFKSSVSKTIPSIPNKLFLINPLPEP